MPKQSLKQKANLITITESKPKRSAKSRKKTARTRRQRGYHWEDTLVKRFNTLDGWKAFRLGSPSVALPDILVVSTQNSSIFTIEAKSGTASSLPVPRDQVERCLKWALTFDIYKTRKVLFAFKFLSKRRIDVGKYESRELREYYKVWDEKKEITDFVCTYDGQTYGLKESKRYDLNLDDYKMPFESRHAMTRH